MNYEQKFKIGDIVKGVRTFNGEIIEGKFNGFHLLNKLNPNSVVGVIETDDRCYDVCPDSIKFAESEDEKIRKDLIDYHKNGLNESPWFTQELKHQDILNWLEKQGEQKPEIEYIYPRFRIGDVIEPIKPNGYYVPQRVEYIANGYYNCKSDDNTAFSSFPINSEDEYQLVEQKSWSEEDEKMKSLIISTLTSMGTLNLERYYHMNLDEVKEWLKSLKPQPRWKPTEEQMEALNWIAYNYALMDKGTEEKLQSLYNDLKSL